MRRSLRAAAFFARDRGLRAVLLAAAAAAVLVPRVLPASGPGPGAAGFRDGLAAGPGATAGTVAGLWGVVLLGGVLLLWQGIVASDAESGRFRTLLARPLWRPGLYLARHGAAIVLLLAAAAAVAGALALKGAGVPPLALPLSALLAGWALGGLLLLLSSLLERGDVLAALALFLAPGALAGPTPPEGLAGAATSALSAILPPVFALRDARHDLAAGAAPAAGDVVELLFYGAVALGLALLRLHTREYRGA